MICPKCKKELEGEPQSCPYCGEALNTLSEKTPETSAESQEIPAADGTAVRKKKAKRTGLPILIFGVVALFVVIAVFGFGSHKKTMSKGSTGSSAYYDEKELVYAKTDSKKTTTSGSYTIMIYMVGSNLESENNQATLDILEMVESRVNVSNVNILIQAGGAKSWALPISKKNTNYLKVIQDGNELDVEKEVEKKGASNMGEADTLTSFLKYGYSHYPADHYSLIFWDHGAAVYGFGHDEVFDDMLTLDEMETAMKKSPFNKKNKLDWVGYDACLMGSLEVAAIWTDYAKYMVASEEIEPGFGWDYSFLSVLNQTFEAPEITKHIVETYADFYKENASFSFNPKVTLSCIDLSKVAPAYNAAVTLLDNIIGEVNMENYDILEDTVCGKVLEYGIDDSSRFYMFDLSDMAATVSKYFPAAAKSLQSAVKSAVISKAGNISKASGLSFYYELAAYVDQSLSEETDSYGRTLNGKSMQAVSVEDFTIEDKQLTENENTAVLHLTDAQRKNTVKAYYTVMVKYNQNDQETYRPIMRECAVFPDNNNDLTVSLTPELLCAKSVANEKNVETSFFSAKQISMGADGVSYTTQHAQAWNAREFLPYGDHESITVKLNVKDDEVVINDVLSSNNSISAAGRQSIDLLDWGYVGFVYDTLIKADSPYSTWEEDETVNLFSLSTGSTLDFCLRNTDEFDEEFVCQIVLVDAAGNEHATRTFDLKNMFDTTLKQTTLSTEKGSLTFNIFDDHAEVFRYKGSDTSITIPETVDGLPVSVICSNVFGTQPEPNNTIQSIQLPDSIKELRTYAFLYCRELTQINIPESVTIIPDDCFYHCDKLAKITLHENIEYIGDFAFATTALKEINLPKSILHLGKGAFADNINLKSITIGGAEEGDYFKVVNGLVLTKDGTELVFGVVNAENNTLVIPDGVLYIDAYALCGAFKEPFPYNIADKNDALTKLVLPEGLKVIGDFAFSGCISLKKIDLPESLETIGDSAFMSFMFQSGENLKTLHIGKNVTSIRKNAFVGYTVNKVEVDEENAYFASYNGKLMNKGGDAELKVFHAEQSN